MSIKSAKRHFFNGLASLALAFAIAHGMSRAAVIFPFSLLNFDVPSLIWTNESQSRRDAKAERSRSQGVAVRNAIHHLGMPEIKSVRIGKFMELEIEGAGTEEKLHEICRDLLQIR